MLKEASLTVQTCDLKVDMNCQGCVKKIKKILQKIDGVYQTNVDRQQGKVTVTGLMDMDAVFKKLKKGSMSAQFWDANSAEEIEENSGGTNDETMVLPPPVTPTPEQDLSNIQQQIEQRLRILNGEKLPPQPMGLPAAINSGQSGKKIGGGSNNPVPRNSINENTEATMVLPPQVTPQPEQHIPSIQQQVEQRLRMLNGEKLPPQPKGMAPGGMQSGKKICGGTVPGNASVDNNNDVAKKLYQDAGGSQVKNGTIGQSPHNGALLLGSLNNNHGQAKRDISVGVGSQMMGRSMAPPRGGMMRPTNNMIGPTSLPGMGKIGGMSTGPYTNYDGYNMQPYGGNGAIHGLGMHNSSLPRIGFYPSGSSSSGMEMNQMMQQVARNPMPQQPYMMVNPQQEHEIMMNAHFPHSQNANYGPGCTGYLPPMYYPMPLPPQDDSIFSDENPNICSLM